LKEGEASYQEVLTVYRDLAKANSQAYRKDLADILWGAALLYLGQGKTTEAHRYFDEAIPLYRKLWQAHPELYAKKFGENLLLNARTLPPKDTEMRCSLLGEAWQVTPSEYISVIGIYQSITLLLCQLR
jgi:tetratricopeptide (TPR) repeat protein